MLSLNFGFVFTIINLLVLYLLMKKFLFRPIMNIMEERERLIQSQLDSAKDTEAAAMALKEKYELTMAGAEEDANVVVLKAKNRAQADYDQVIREARTEANRLLKENEKAMEAERQRTIQGVSKDIAGLAVAVAEKAVARQGNADFDEKMMDAFLEEEGVR